MKVNAESLDIKRALYIDNDNSEEYNLFENFLNEVVKKKGGEVKILYRAFLHPEELRELLAWCDCLCFHSTFQRQEQIEAVGVNLKFLNPKASIICFITSGRVSESVYSKVMKIFDEKHIRIFNSFKLFELDNTSIYLDPNKNDKFWLNPFDFNDYISSFDSRVQRLKDKKKLVNFKPTGRKVLIKEIKAFGQQWSNLKPGMIVDELDCLSIEENIYRGIWVEGLSEPVKLLNSASDSCDEWTFVEPNAIGLAIEIMSMIVIESASLFSAFANWIRITPSLEPSEIHEGLSTLCGNKKRGNIRRIEKLISDYCSRHQFFMDDTVDIHYAAIKEENRRRIFDEQKKEKQRLNKLDHYRKHGITPEELTISENDYVRSISKQEQDTIIDFLDMIKP